MNELHVTTIHGNIERNRCETIVITEDDGRINHYPTDLELGMAIGMRLTSGSISGQDSPDATQIYWYGYIDRDNRRVDIKILYIDGANLSLSVITELVIHSYIRSLTDD